MNLLNELQPAPELVRIFKEIDAKTFREHMDRLREQEAMAKLERYDAELEDLDAWAAASSLRAFEH